MKEYRETVTQILLMYGCVEGRRYNVRIKKVFTLHLYIGNAISDTFELVYVIIHPRELSLSKCH